MQACGLISLVDYFNVDIHDIWEGNVTTREIQTEHIPFPSVLGYTRRSNIMEGGIPEGDITRIRVSLKVTINSPIVVGHSDFLIEK